VLRRPSLEILCLVFDSGEMSFQSDTKGSLCACLLMSMNSLGSSVVQVNFVLNVEICTPMADLCSSLQIGDLQNGHFITVVDRDALLISLYESSVHWLNVVERPIGDRRSSPSCGSILGGVVLHVSRVGE
jgi:hypothetical protein